MSKSLEYILNDCLNKAMCQKGRIQQPNSNNIADFVYRYLQDEKLTIDTATTKLSFGDWKFSQGLRYMSDFTYKNTKGELFDADVVNKTYDDYYNL